MAKPLRRAIAASALLVCFLAASPVVMAGNLRDGTAAMEFAGALGGVQSCMCRDAEQGAVPWPPRPPVGNCIASNESGNGGLICCIARCAPLCSRRRCGAGGAAGGGPSHAADPHHPQPDNLPQEPDRRQGLPHQPSFHSPVLDLLQQQGGLPVVPTLWAWQVCDSTGHGGLESTQIPCLSG
jgi:hypothetical protein